MNEWEGWSEARVLAELRQRFRNGEFPHNTTALYYNRDVAGKLLEWGVLEVVRVSGHVRFLRLARDAEYRVLWHTAGTDKPADLRELAAIHRDKVRRGEVPPWLRGVV